MNSLQLIVLAMLASCVMAFLCEGFLNGLCLSVGVGIALFAVMKHGK